MPIADLIVATLFVMGLVIGLWLAISVAIDVIRSPDMSGVSKAAWLLVIFVVPLLGSLIYVIVRGDTMERRADERRRAEAAAERGRIDSAAHMDVDAEVAKLADLRDRGVISAEDFEDQKSQFFR